jgi:hypothetical protein
LPNSTRVLAHILTHRELERKDATEVVRFDDRKSRRVTAMLHKRGIHRGADPLGTVPYRLSGLLSRLD